MAASMLAATEAQWNGWIDEEQLEWQRKVQKDEAECNRAADATWGGIIDGYWFDWDSSSNVC